MIEAKLRSTKLELAKEREKRKLLENQAARLTEELTRYLLIHPFLGNLCQTYKNTQKTQTQIHGNKHRNTRFHGMCTQKPV